MKAYFNSSFSWFKSAATLGTALLCAVAIQVSAQTNCATPPAGLVSWWRGEGDALDNTGDVHGTLLNGVAFTAGEVGQAFSFDGVNDAITNNRPGLTNIVSSYTMEFWAFPNASRASTTEATSGLAGTSNQRYAIFPYYGGNSVLGAGVSVGTNGVSVFEHGNGYLPSLLVYNASIIGWTHIAVVYENRQPKLYINGVQVRVGLTSLNPSCPSTWLGTGAWSASNYGHYAGMLDEVSIYNRAVSANEIQAIYNASSAGKCTTPAPIVDFVGAPTTGVAPLTVVFTNQSSGANNFTWDFGDGKTSVAVNPTNIYTNAGSYTVKLTVVGAGGTKSLTRTNYIVVTAFAQGAVNFANGAVGVNAPIFHSDGTNTLSSSQYRAELLGGVSSGALSSVATTPFLTGAGAGYFTGGDQLIPGVVGGGTAFIQIRVWDTIKGTTYELAQASGQLDAWGASAIFSVVTGNPQGSPPTWPADLVDLTSFSLNSRPFYYAPTITAQPTNVTVNVGQWASFSVTATGSVPLAYQWSLNGTNLDGATNNLLTLTNVQVGQAGNYAVVVTNEAGSVTSSNAVLTVNPLPPCMNPAVGIVSWWRGEGDVNDFIGGNNGVLQGSAGFVAGKVGQALSLNGSNAYVSVAANPNLNVGAGEGMTIECWIKPADLTRGQAIAEWNNGAGGLGVHFWISIPNYGGLGSIFVNVQDTSNIAHYFATAPNVLNTNSFQHIAFTFNKTNGTGKIFLNGSVVATQNLGLIAPQTSYNLYLGSRVSAVPVGSFFKGLLDEVSLYNRALADSEIQAIYNAASSGKCVVPVAPFIISQPTNQTVTVGGTASFNVIAGGTSPLSYRWSLNGTNIDGATNSSLTLSNVQFSQSGNYTVVVTNVAGSATSSNALLTANFPPATVGVVSTNAAAASSVTVPVVLVANGNENALGFSLNFTTSRLAYASVSLGSGGAGASLLVNDSQAGNGKLGIALSLGAGSTFPAGTQAMVTVTFTTAVVISNTVTAIGFGDSPIVRQLSDALVNPLAATYAFGTVTIAAVEYEGDLSPRPAGDRLLTITDWVLAGRYAARLDYPTNASEFQRADSAPRDTLGNGAITVSDWVQAGRYAAGLDPATPVGGPTAEALSSSVTLKRLGKNDGPNGLSNRQVQVMPAVLAQNQMGTVRVNLEAQGDENALGFSLTFDPAVFHFASATLGSAATGASLNVNTNQANSGVLGFVLALPANTSFAAGTREVVKVSLRASASPTNGYPVSFTNHPVPPEVSDKAAHVLTADYLNGTVVVNPPPSLAITLAGPNILLSWPLWASNFAPQVAVSVLPPGTWTNVAGAVGVSNNENSVTVPISAAMKFYRLSGP